MYIEYVCNNSLDTHIYMCIYVYLYNLQFHFLSLFNNINNRFYDLHNRFLVVLAFYRRECFVRKENSMKRREKENVRGIF